MLELKLVKANPGNVTYIRRFSMCNCVTLYFPDTYTAHGMTLDFFLNKVAPNIRIPLIHTDLWPHGYVKVFKIPKKIKTFLFSPFNETYHLNYRFADGIRYAIGPHPGAKPLKLLAKKIPRLSSKDFEESLVRMNNKVNDIWDNPLKILVLYDTATADVKTKKRLMLYDDIAMSTVNWPIVRIVDIKPKKAMWCHYSNQTQVDLLRKIVVIEKRSMV